MRLLAPCALFCAFAISATAHADTVTVFDINGTLEPGTVHGTVTIDTTTGTVTASDFTVLESGNNYVFDTVDIIGEQRAQLYYAQIRNSADDIFIVRIQTPSLVGFTGSALCSDSATCTSDGSPGLASYLEVDLTSDFLASGSLTPAIAPVPEPSSIALLGTGVLGFASMARRKFFAGSAR